MTSRVPAVRVRLLSGIEVRPSGDWVLYWMVASRRTRSNFALERAVEWSTHLGKPLLVFEPLGLGYRWASDRLHRFVLDGMADNQKALAGRPGVLYLPWVETTHGAGQGLLAALAARAAVVVTDDFPAFIVPRMLQSAAREVTTRFEAVDANGLLPMRQPNQAFPTAHAFRRYLQRTFGETFPLAPTAEPLQALPAHPQPALPAAIAERWPTLPTSELIGGSRSLSTLPIDHTVGSTGHPGGPNAATARLTMFLAEGLSRYADQRNQLEADASSHLSPYLHFGHISVWEVFHQLMAREGWSGALPARATGAKEGWWGVSSAAESFLDQLVTWRELGFNTCVQWSETFDRFESLPAWARATLHRHRDDARTSVYDLDEFERGDTHDPLWNAAQGQLIQEGRIQNYVRMLWGKKIVEWSPSPEAALDVMIELNNKYALDGRDPNSYNGICWTLGRYDRPWTPERPIFGSVRYMSSDNTARKMRTSNYIRRYAPAASSPEHCPQRSVRGTVPRHH
jgi:deoxyribodipyrimidine photo-lyase